MTFSLDFILSYVACKALIQIFKAKYIFLLWRFTVMITDFTGCKAI